MTQEETTSQFEYVASEIKKRADAFHSSVAWFRRRHYVAQMGTVLLSAVVTVLAGIKTTDTSALIPNVILVLGATITVVSAWGAFFSPRESWLIYASTLSRLRALQTKVEFASRNSNQTPTPSTGAQQFLDEYQKILDDHEQRWQELRKT